MFKITYFILPKDYLNKEILQEYVDKHKTTEYLFLNLTFTWDKKKYFVSLSFRLKNWEYVKITIPFTTKH